MRVEFQKEDGVPNVLDIIFWKTPVDDRRGVRGRELIDTYCQISRIEYADKSTTAIIGMPSVTEAIAFQNPLDKYNKIVGKKVALAKAIANIEFLRPVPYSQYHYQSSSPIFTSQCKVNQKRRAMRQRIWDTFYQTFGGWN